MTFGKACAAILLLVLAAGCAHDEPETVDVFAAASTTDVIGELAAAFTAEGGPPVRCNFASSSALARQIDRGAQADLYLSANARWMDWLVSRGGVDPGGRVDLLANRLVFVAPTGSELRVRFDRAWDLPGAFRGELAVGDPTHVPAGIYARQVLERYGWWEGMSFRLATALSVRAALRLVETGAAPLGVVYASDALASDAVEVVGEVPEEAHEPIRYPVAPSPGAGPGAEAFLAYLRSPGAAEVFRRHGFVPVAGPSGEPGP